jgi:hypothetical protein
MKFHQGWNGNEKSLFAGTMCPRADEVCAEGRTCSSTPLRTRRFRSKVTTYVANKRSFICFESMRSVTAVTKGCACRFVQVIQPGRWRSAFGCTNAALSIHHASNDVKKVFSNRTLMGMLLSGTLVLAGCGAPPPKDFGGAWKPVNRFPATTTVIPLNQQYEFFASPMDGTLKTMLTRWAKDSGLTLSYRITDDYTLTAQASQIHTLDIHVAIGQLNTIYASQGVLITSSDRQIDVGVLHTAAAPDSDSSKMTSSGAKSSASP